MGLFDKAFGGISGSEPFGPHEGFAGILLGASACDGHIADEEMQALFTQLTRMKMFSRYGDKHWEKLMNRLMGLLKKKGVGTLLEKSVEAVPPELAETVFANACDIVLGDGTVEDDEKEFLSDLHDKLGIEKARAQNIVKVMVIKNKG